MLIRVLSAFLTLFIIFFSNSIPVAAQRFEVQPALQAALFKKVLLMAGNTANSKPSVLIVFDSQHFEDAAAMVKAFEDIGIALIISRNGQLPESLNSVVAAFVSSPSAEAENHFARNGILTLTGSRDMVIKGQASLAFINEGGKPRPIINKRRLVLEKKQDLIGALQSVAIMVE